MSNSDFEIPGYKLVEPIGKGGMASVYRAVQHAFNRNVAIKLLDPELSKDASFCERFMMESQLIAKLNHSHIVQVYDVGVVKDHYFIAMEYLSGGNLTEQIKAGLNRHEAIKILKQIASALAFAHRKGIIHRDLKPDNVMFREDGAAVLTDFGVAKELDTNQDLTQTGVIIGTPKYMSPEQIRGAKPSTASDIYSLGVLFYQLLTREVPFLGADLVTTVYKQLNDPIPILPANLERYQVIIDQLLAKNADERINDCDQLIEMLEVIESQPTASITDDDKTVVLNQTWPISDTTEVIDPGRTEVITQDNGYQYRNTEQPVETNTTESAHETDQKQSRSGLILSLIMVIGVVAGTGGYLLQQTEAPGLQTPIEQTVKSEEPIPIEEPETIVSVTSTEVHVTQSTEVENKIVITDLPPEDEIIADEVKEPVKQIAQPIPIATSQLPQTKPAKPAKQKTILSLKQSMQIDGLFHGAAMDEKEGRWTSPVGNNALDKYQRILNIQPDNQRAIDKIASLKSR